MDHQAFVCGTWTATIFGSKPSEGKTGIDTLHIKKNGKFVLKRFSTMSLPGIYTGKWQIQNDSVVLNAESGGMLLIDEKGKPVTEKLKDKKIIKLSIVIHSEEEIYLSTSNCSYTKVSKVTGI